MYAQFVFGKALKTFALVLHEMCVQNSVLRHVGRKSFSVHNVVLVFIGIYLVCWPSVKAQESLDLSVYDVTNTSAFTIGYITTLEGAAIDAEGSTISGAMTYAVENINNDANVLPNHTLRFIFADNRGRDLTSINVLTELWKDEAIAFVGPEDFCDTEARVAASWNLPMVSYKCDDPVVSDKSHYPTFARTQPPSSQSAKSVIALMNHYGWTRFTIVAEDTALLLKAGQNLQRLAELNNITVNDFVNVSEYSSIYNENELGQIVQSTYLRTRVYVLYTLTELFIDFVNFMQTIGLTDTDEYVVIGVRDNIAYDHNLAERYMFHAGSSISSRTNQSVAAFRSVFLLMTMPITNPNYEVWEDEIRARLYRPPFNLPRTELEIFLDIEVAISIYASYLYDAVMVYAKALHEILLANESPRNGLAVFQHIKDRTYTSILGHDSYIDENGDAEANYTVLALQPDDNRFGFGLKPIGRFLRDSRNRKNLTFLEDISVYGDNVPLDEPLCGYDGEKCKPDPDNTAYIAGGCLAGIFLIVFCVLLGIYRNWRYEQQLASLIWKIDPKEIQLQTDAAFSALSIISNNAPYSNASLSLGPEQEQRFTRLGVYKGSLVALKVVKTRHTIDITRNIKLELKHIRDLRHNNIVQFIGATVESHVSNIVTEYCSKGSLEDILENSDLKLDHMFIASIVSDIMKGLSFIHTSPVVFHGDLKSSNCLVDSRWVIKLSDFGLKEFKSKQIVPYHGEHALYKCLLWTAPELLRADPKVATKGTQKGDVYSFGILLYEILCRNGPYGDCHRTPKAIVQRVRQGPVDGIPFRPNTNQLSCDGYITQVMRECWDEDPDNRPDMRICRNKLRPMQRGMRSNIFDNMMNLMERYANNLETVVAERTGELHEEKKKTEMLLHRMLPPSVAAQLVRGDPVIPEAYESVTIYFSDICGFTSLSSESTPLQVVDMLNDLYTLFDRIIKSYDVYKIETIGDAYMVVSGLPRRNGNNHAGEIASMSLNLLSCIKQFKVRHRPDDMLKLRIGIHCALRIHVSTECKAILDELGGYTLVERGLVAMKGKGELLTYWLQDEDVSVRELRTRTSDDSGVQTESPSDAVPELPHFPSKPAIMDADQAMQNASLIPCIRSSLIFEHHDTSLSPTSHERGKPKTKRKKKSKRERNRKSSSREESGQPHASEGNRDEGSGSVRNRSEDWEFEQSSAVTVEGTSNGSGSGESGNRSCVITVSEYQSDLPRAEVRQTGLFPILKNSPSRSTDSASGVDVSGTGSNGERGTSARKGQATGLFHNKTVDAGAPPGNGESEMQGRMFYHKNGLHPLVRIQAEHARHTPSDSQGSSCLADVETSSGRQNHTVTFSGDAAFC